MALLESENYKVFNKPAKTNSWLEEIVLPFHCTRVNCQMWGIKSFSSTVLKNGRVPDAVHQEKQFWKGPEWEGKRKRRRDAGVQGPRDRQQHILSPSLDLLTQKLRVRPSSLTSTPGDSENYRRCHS